jgi:hypothetical protein
MNIIIFLIRVFAGLTFLLMALISADPTKSNKSPNWYPNPVAAVGSLLLATLYLWPLIAEARSRQVVASIPTERSFTSRRFFTFGRWGLAYFLGIMTIDLLLRQQYNCGILSLMAIPWLMPPLDRLLFASGSEFAARLKSYSSFFKLFPNLGALLVILTIGESAQKDYPVSITLLLVGIGLFLVVPIVLLVKGGWKALSLKSLWPPAPMPREQLKTSVGRPDMARPAPVRRPAQPIPSRQKQAPRKYYSANAWHWNWPLPKGMPRYPLDERGFNLLIREFEASWLESKNYHQRLALHRDPPAFLRELIAEVEAYIQSMRLRPELRIRNKPLDIAFDPVLFVPEEVSRIWKADKRLRSLYQATRQFAQSPMKQLLIGFRSIAPHVAEYRAMINLVKHLRHSLGRMPGQNSKMVSVPIIKPMQTEGKVPVVFVSYSWDSPEHEAWVVKLATKLRENGVDAILDKWDLGLLGKLLPHFMETAISRSDRVICIMTPNYKKKTENLTGGVGYEYSIITAEIFTNNINTTKFIPLFRNGADANAIPTALRGRMYVDMRDDTQFDEKFIHELLRDIHDEPKFRKPAIGEKTKF